jgi:hypothetical protein
VVVVVVVVFGVWVVVVVRVRAGVRVGVGVRATDRAMVTVTVSARVGIGVRVRVRVRVRWLVWTFVSHFPLVRYWIFVDHTYPVFLALLEFLYTGKLDPFWQYMALAHSFVHFTCKFKMTYMVLVVLVFNAVGGQHDKIQNT